MMSSSQTIYALATPLGGAIAVIRISGDKTLPVLRKIFTGKIDHSKLYHGMLVSGDEPKDDIMAVFFRSPNSYTGEDMAELHIHGSRAIADEVFMLLSKNGLRPAQAGEFSLRAFQNGKMNLTQAEAVMDLISSTAKRSAASAMLQLTGKLFTVIHEIQEKLINILAEIDAAIDYPDEMEDSNVLPQVFEVERDISDLLSHAMQGRYLREGFTVAIAGKPNVGKSSLLNALISEDRAIVTDIAGTTRDIIEADAAFSGVPVHLCDTAGLHEASDQAEKIGIERARRAVECADIVYVVIDLSMPFVPESEELLSQTRDKKRIIVLCKSDIAKSVPEFPHNTVCVVSTVTGEGIQTLKEKTAEMVCPSDESGIITNMRHISCLCAAQKSLHDACSAVDTDCMAQDLHMALSALGNITGDSVDEDVITRIFERFCVGK